MNNLLQVNLPEANIRHKEGGTSALGKQGEDAIWNYIVMNGSEELYDVSDNKAFFGQCVDIIEKLSYGITVFHEVKTEQWPIGKTIEECYCEVNSRMPILEDMANSKALFDIPYKWHNLHGTCNLSVEIYAENERGEAGKGAGCVFIFPRSPAQCAEQELHPRGHRRGVRFHAGGSLIFSRTASVFCGRNLSRRTKNEITDEKRNLQ